MKTIHHPARSVNDRCSHQCARPGWRAAQCSPHQQAANIAASIEARIAEGRAWSMAEYTDNPSIIALVLQLLPTKTPAQIDSLKREWFADPTFLLEDIDGFEVHRAELIEFRLTHTAWAEAQAEDPPCYIAWEWRVTEEAAARIEAKRLIARYLGWMSTPIDSNLQTIEVLAQTLVDAATLQQEASA